MTAEASREWLAVAEIDLRAARNCLHGPDPTTVAAAFHCQQAAEKLIKAVLIAQGINPPRSHNITALVELLPTAHALRPQLQELEPLTLFAVAFRYPPGDILANPPEPGISEIDGWLRLIETLRDQALAAITPQQAPG